MKANEMQQPTDAELEILTTLWDLGSATVREVNDKLNERRNDKKEIGYTTTLKLLQIMFEKGLVTRNAEARTHVYEAAYVQRNLLQRVVDTAFQGSAMQMVMQVLGDHDASAEELQEIKALIEKVEQSKK